MSARVALLLGLLLVVAAFVRGGIYSAGHDFVVNRFTGQFEFVPADEDEDTSTQVRAAHHTDSTLTRRRPRARVQEIDRRRGAERNPGREVIPWQVDGPSRAMSASDAKRSGG